MAITPYACAHGTSGLSDAVSLAHRDAPVVVWANHGISVFADTIEEAVDIAIAVEELSRRVVYGIFLNLCERGVLSESGNIGRGLSEALASHRDSIAAFALQVADIREFQEQLTKESKCFPAVDPARTDRRLTDDEREVLVTLVAKHAPDIAAVISSPSFERERREALEVLMAHDHGDIALELREAIVVTAPEALIRGIHEFEESFGVTVFAVNLTITGQNIIVIVAENNVTEEEILRSLIHEASALNGNDDAVNRRMERLLEVESGGAQVVVQDGRPEVDAIRQMWRDGRAADLEVQELIRAWNDDRHPEEGLKRDDDVGVPALDGTRGKARDPAEFMQEIPLTPDGRVPEHPDIPQELWGKRVDELADAPFDPMQVLVEDVAAGLGLPLSPMERSFGTSKEKV